VASTFSLRDITGNDARPGITNRDRERFSGGDCHYLARALSLRTRWPIYAFTDDDEETAGIPTGHAFVLADDGRAIDVEGAHDLADLSDQWADVGQVVCEFPFACLRKAWGGPNFSGTYERAHLVAEAILQELEAPTAH
jgi:hypothetical protein